MRKGKQFLENNMLLTVICIAVILMVFIIAWKTSLKAVICAVDPINRVPRQETELTNSSETQFSIKECSLLA